MQMEVRIQCFFNTFFDLLTGTPKSTMAALVFWLGERLDAVNSPSCDCLLFEANGKGRERAVFPLGGMNHFRVVVLRTHF